MTKGRIYVDFNELIDENLVLLSKEDTKINSLGEVIQLYEGLRVDIYDGDLNDLDEVDNLVASGIVERNNTGMASVAKWLCRIDSNGISHESDLKKQR